MVVEGEKSVWVTKVNRIRYLGTLMSVKKKEINGNPYNGF